MRPYIFDNNAFVVLDGELDISRQDQMREALPNPGEIKSCVINLTRATYIDSFVVGMLVQFRRRFVEAGGAPEAVTLMLPKTGSVRRAIELTGITRLFSIAYVDPGATAEDRMAGSIKAP